MPSSRPTLLTENTGLVFIGEKPWPAAQLTARQAKSLEEVQNPTGRPNADVLRYFVGVDSGHIREHAQVDFPSHFTEQESALYIKPFAHLHSAKKDRTHSGWLNPNAQTKLRTALARLDRYLATPLAAELPAWNWVDSHQLPDATLLAVTRDDDFTHGLFQSSFFKAWWRHWSSPLSRLEIVQTFPFPWAPATLLSALTRTQEEHRLAIARAARSGEQSSLDPAVAAAYGWPADLSGEEIITHLEMLNRQRATGFA